LAVAPVLTAVALDVLGGALAGFLTHDERTLLPPRLVRFAGAFLVLAAGSAIGRFRPLDPSFQPWSEMHRRAGTFTDPNALGIGIGLLVPLLLAALARRGTSTDGARRGAALVA